MYKSNHCVCNNKHYYQICEADWYRKKGSRAYTVQHMLGILSSSSASSSVCPETPRVFNRISPNFTVM